MFKPISAFSSFSVSNLDKAKEFYSQKLGLDVKQDEMGLRLNLPGNFHVFIYPKDNHIPATFTVLNLVVENINLAVDELVNRNIVFEKYEGMHQDEKGVLRGLSNNMGPDIAWFEDPAGNVISIIQEK